MTDESQSPSMAVIRAVADREEVDPHELKPPLYEVIETDALDSLFRATKGRVSFSYAGYGVTVDHEGDVRVTGPD